MSSSPERLRLARAPRAVRVHEGPAAEALEALFEARAREREAAAAAAARSELADDLARVSAGFEAELTALGEELARAAVVLGVEVARSILRVELPRERYDLAPVIRECLALGTEGRGAAQVHLSPGDAARLADLPLRAGTELVADAGVGRGEVRVESPLGVVVRDPDACLERAREALLEELAR